MALKNYVLAGAAIIALGACGNSESASAPEAAAAQAAPTETVANTTTEATAPIVNGAISGVYATEPNHRYITFSYLHQGLSRPMLRWRDWTGELNFNADDPAASSVTVDINASSVDSGVDVFDGHLNGDRFFDTANFPAITFASTSVTKTGAATADIAGQLTIKGVTRPATVHATFNKGEYAERGNVYKIGFSGTAQVNRSEFGLDFMVPIVSDAVDIKIETEWTMPAPESE